jgi:hypothetical protein
LSPVAAGGPATENTGGSPLAGRRRRAGHKTNRRAGDQKTKPPMNPEPDSSPVTHRKVENSPLRTPNKIPQLAKRWDLAPTTASAQALICSPQPWGPRNELARRKNHAPPYRTPEPQPPNIRRKSLAKSLPNDAYSKIPVAVQSPRSRPPNALRTSRSSKPRLLFQNPWGSPGPPLPISRGEKSIGHQKLHPSDTLRTT